MLDGVARKVGLIAAGATGLGWLLIVIGFGLATAPIIQVFNNPLVGSIFFPQWLISLGGIPFIALAVVHAVVSKGIAGKILGTITALCSVLFLLSLGMILFFQGLTLNTLPSSSISRFTSSTGVMFAGSLFASLCWMVLLMAWPFYEVVEAS